MTDTARPMDPQEQLRLIDEQQARVQRAIEPSVAGILAVWGAAWFVGYLTLHLTRTPFGGPTWAWVVFGGVLVLAGVYTAATLVRSQAGMRGPTRTEGTLYGFAWSIAFVAIFVLAGRIADLTLAAGLSEPQRHEIQTVLMNFLVCLVIGVIYMVGNALWRSPVEWALGAWIVVVAVVASLVPIQWLYLIMAVAGGGGFLVGAVLVRARERRVRHHPTGGAR